MVQLSVIELSKLLHHAGCLSERSKVTVIILLRNAILMCCFNSRAHMRASKAIGYSSEFVSLSRAVRLSPNCPAVSLLALTAPLDLGSVGASKLMLASGGSQPRSRRSGSRAPRMAPPKFPESPCVFLSACFFLFRRRPVLG